MNSANFEKNSKQLLGYCWNLLFTKASEYANDDDRLANFKQITSMMQTNPAQVAFWYDLKHIASLAKIVQEIDQGKIPTREYLLEKMGDYLNYGMLIYAAIIELIEENDGTKALSKESSSCRA